MGFFEKLIYKFINFTRKNSEFEERDIEDEE